MGVLVGFGVGLLLPDWDLSRRHRAAPRADSDGATDDPDMLTLATSADGARARRSKKSRATAEGVVARELRLLLRVALGQRRTLDDGRAMARSIGSRRAERVIGALGATYSQGLPLAVSHCDAAQCSRSATAAPRDRGRWKGDRTHAVSSGGVDPTASLCSSPRARGGQSSCALGG